MPRANQRPGRSTAHARAARYTPAEIRCIDRAAELASRSATECATSEGDAVWGRQGRTAHSVATS